MGTPRAGAGRHRGREGGVARHVHGGLPRVEAPHVPVGGVAGGDVEAVVVERRMRGDHDDGVGRVRGDAAGHLLVRVDGGLDGALLAVPHRRHDERGMRYDVGGDDAHGRLLTLQARPAARHVRLGGWRALFRHCTTPGRAPRALRVPAGNPARKRCRAPHPPKPTPRYGRGRTGRAGGRRGSGTPASRPAPRRAGPPRRWRTCGSRARGSRRGGP